MPLSESDQLIARKIADSRDVREALGRRGPVPEDLWPLAESYVVFLRHGPTAGAEPPPAIWALAQAHREAGRDHFEFRTNHPDLNRVAQASLDLTKRFFTQTYQLTRDACLRGQPNLDPAIWPESPAKIVGPELRPRPFLAGALGVMLAYLCIAGLGFEKTGFSFLLLAALAFFGVLIGFMVRVSRLERSEQPVTDDVVRQSLLKALPARSQDGVQGRRAAGDAAGEAVVGALGVGVGIASLFDW